MACSGGHCSYHNKGTTTCSGHRAVCATNRQLSVSSDFGVEGKPIRASDINNLRDNIRNELARWDVKYGPYNYYQSDAYVAGATKIDNTQINQLENMVAQIKGGGASYGDGALIDNTHWANLAARYNVMRQDCICNSDCSCNAICACYNDCGCHYWW